MSATKPREGPSFIPRNLTVSLLTSCNQNGLLGHVTDMRRCFMLHRVHSYIQCINQQIHSVKRKQNTDHKIQFTASIKLLRVSAWGSHSGAKTCRSFIVVMDCTLWFLSYCVLLSALVCWCIEYTGVSQSAGASSSKPEVKFVLWRTDFIQTIIQNSALTFTENTLRSLYKDQSVDVIGV